MATANIRLVLVFSLAFLLGTVLGEGLASRAGSGCLACRSGGSSCCLSPCLLLCAQTSYTSFRLLRSTHEVGDLRGSHLLVSECTAEKPALHAAVDRAAERF